MSVPIEWNAESPWRCPSCNAGTDPDMKARWRIVTCCRCGCEFTRYPRFNFGRAGIVCIQQEHGEASHHVTKEK